MKIYGVNIANKFTGGSLSTKLYRLKKDAITEAKAIASDCNERFGSDYKFSKIEDKWKDMNDYIEVVECELI